MPRRGWGNPVALLSCPPVFRPRCKVVSMSKSCWLMMVGACVVLGGGCSSETPVKPLPPVPPAGAYGGYGDYVDESLITFKDEVVPQPSPEADLTALTFTDKEGKQIALKDFLGQKHLVLVITRGYGGSICPYCATQTARLIANYPKLQALNAEVVVVYPLAIPADIPRVDDFVARAVMNLPATDKKVPFPLLLDVELKAVDALGIRKDLSKPATYIFDREGQLRFAYVGTSLADRPSIKALLDQLGQINQTPKS